MFNTSKPLVFRLIPNQIHTRKDKRTSEISPSDAVVSIKFYCFDEY